MKSLVLCILLLGACRELHAAQPGLGTRKLLQATYIKGVVTSPIAGPVYNADETPTSACIYLCLINEHCVNGSCVPSSVQASSAPGPAPAPSPQLLALQLAPAGQPQR